MEPFIKPVFTKLHGTIYMMEMNQSVMTFPQRHIIEGSDLTINS